MSSSIDWLSRLLNLVPVSGHLDIRCLYGAPWEVVWPEANDGEIPYHVIVEGSAILENPKKGQPHHLTAGDILILPHGIPHTLRDGGGAPAKLAQHQPLTNIILSKNAGKGAKLDMLCGHFTVTPPHDRLLRAYLPPWLIARSAPEHQTNPSETGMQLSNLVKLMRSESTNGSLGGLAMLNALSSALFALVLRLASESITAPTGLLALAGNPRLTPALAALFKEPAKPWTMPELAAICNMSRATFARHFQDSMGRSANDLLTDIRMTMAANQLKLSSISTSALSEAVGYQSEAAFQRAFKSRMGVTPARWRRDTMATEVPN